MIHSALAKLKAGLKKALRPSYRVVQKGVLRLVSPAVNSLENEIASLRHTLALTMHEEPIRSLKPFSFEELTPETRTIVRQQLQIPDGQFVLVAPGIVRLDIEVMNCLYALEQVRYWGVPAQLFFLGLVEPGISDRIHAWTANLSLEGNVHFFDRVLYDSVYRDYLIAADGAIQLSGSDERAFPASLSECLSAGLPTVCTGGLAKTIRPPSFLQTIPDHLSPLLLAERILEFHEMAGTQAKSSKLRSRNMLEYLQNYYSPQVLEQLLAS